MPLAVQRWVRRLPWTARRRHRPLLAEASDSRRLPVRLVAAPPRLRTTDVTGSSPVPTPQLDARLLGGVEVSVGGRPVTRWHSRKATAVLGYLLLNRDRPVPRDTLATAFWPDVPADSARNRLHVVLHGMRADLKAASPTRVVVFDHHGYSIDPSLTVGLDTDRFRLAAVRGEQAERRAEPDVALAAYESAIQEFRGDLLAERLWCGPVRTTRRTSARHRPSHPAPTVRPISTGRVGDARH